MSEHPLVAEYRNFSPNSAAFSARASQVFPGGDTRASAHYKPYPLAIERAAPRYLFGGATYVCHKQPYNQ